MISLSKTERTYTRIHGYYLYGEKDLKGSCNYSCFDIFIFSCVLFLQDVLQDKPMGAMSVFMTGNYLRQPVDDDGLLSLRWWSHVD